MKKTLKIKKYLLINCFIIILIIKDIKINNKHCFLSPENSDKKIILQDLWHI